MKKLILTTMVVLSTCILASAQTIIKGIVSDKDNETRIAFANITIGNQGTVSDTTGTFEIRVMQGSYKLKINLIGYQPIEIAIKAINGQTLDMGTIFIQKSVLDLKEVNIISGYAQERKTPIAASTIKALTIERKLGNQELPEIMKMSPGVYATRQGGGTGDASLNIRGFKQENVALLLNGVPVGSVDNGLVYWSNWEGLADASQSIQVQRGLGASKVAVNSVGGTVNIITKAAETQKGGSLKYAFTDYGNSKTTLSLSTGKMKNGLAVTFLGSRTKGPGYVDATYVDAWSYFLTVSYDLSKKHKIVFTGVGSPEHHGQRSYGLTKDEFKKYGNKYNYNWGEYNGKIDNLTENFYHKPQLFLNDYWTISERTSLITSIYYSYGYGGGKWSESFGNEPGISSYRKNNQVDWDKVYELNANNTDTYTLANGQTVSGYSKNIATNYLASHYWYGIVSSLNHELTPHLKLTAGIHARNFKSRLYETVRDLMGGQFWIDDYAYAVDGVAGRSQIKKVGDITKTDNRSFSTYGSAFSQIEYNKNNLTVFIAGTASATTYQREDDYNYVNNTKSDKLTREGFDVKSGINYNINEHHNVYFNAGYYSREPYFKFVFVNYSNVAAKDLKNEKIKTLELGYGYKDNKTNVRLNGYYTFWQDKSLLSNENILLVDSTQTRAMIRGLNSLHKGIELEFTTQPLSWLTLGGSASIADWKWKNNVKASLYDENNHLVDTTHVYADGLYVGDAPQTQLGLTASINLFPGFSLASDWVYYDRLYADFDPATRNNPNDNHQPYRMPSYGLLDLHFIYDFDLLKNHASAGISCFNVTDKETMMRGDDGPNHDEAGFRGFWTFGRTFNLSLKVQF